MKQIGEVGFMGKPAFLDPAPNDVIIQTRAAITCKSDVHMVDGGVGARENRTLGHEASA
jgi:threonine dehydrogenase-like Zn-dependent dehydrogenase